MSSTRSPGRSPRRSKSTVSTGISLLVSAAAVLLVVGGDRLLVDLGHLGRDGAPAEQLVDALAAVRAHHRAALGVVEQRGQRRLQLADVAGSDQVGAVA